MKSKSSNVTIGDVVGNVTINIQPTQPVVQEKHMMKTDMDSETFKSYIHEMIKGVITTLGGGRTDANQLVPLTESRLAWIKMMKVNTGKSKKKTKYITRRPYDKACGRKYNADFDFMEHERHQILDDLFAARDAHYGIITFEAAGKAESEDLMRVITVLVQRGYRDSRTGISWKCIYGQYHGDGFLVFANKESGIKTLEDLGITAVDDTKTNKYVKRIMASHPGGMIKATYVQDFPVHNGHVWIHKLNNGQLIRTLDYNMDLLGPVETAIVDGKVVCNIKGFTNCSWTGFAPFGVLKGTASPNDALDYDIISYGTKDKVKLIGSKDLYIGKLTDVALHPLTMDAQTMVNAGYYAPNLVPRLGKEYIDKITQILCNPDEAGIRDLVAGLVRSEDSKWEAGVERPEWPLIRAIKSGIGCKSMPVLFRRLTNLLFETTHDVARGRVPMEGVGIRVYVRDNPRMTNPDGSIDVRLDGLFDSFNNGLRNVCIPDAPEGRVMIYRNPNTNSHEMMLVNNIHVPELMVYAGEGWAFLGADAGEILDPLNGGDMDDNIGVIWDKEFMAKYETMYYPIQPRITEKELAIKPTAIQLNNDQTWMGRGKNWNFNVLLRQLESMCEFGVSLGTFINRGMLDTLLSGENGDNAFFDLNDGKYILPKGFTPPSVDVLDELLGRKVLDVTQTYVPTLSGFIDICKQWLINKPDFITARAMSNADKVIDWTQAGKGNRDLVMELVEDASWAEATPVFPVSYEQRIPAKRKAAGDYILVWTLQCRAIQALKEHRDAALAELKRMETLIVRPLSTLLDGRYMTDQNVVDYAQNLRSWWVASLANAKTEEGGLNPLVYKQIADGWDKPILHVPSMGRPGELLETEEHHIGLQDLFNYRYESMTLGMPKSVKLSKDKLSKDFQVRLVIAWLNTVYTRKSGEYGISDGVPNWMLNILFDAYEELGMTGQVEFLVLTYWAKKNISEPVVVTALENGMVMIKETGKIITKIPSWTLPDGDYLMSPAGVIVVQEAHPELRSDWKPGEVINVADGQFGYDADADDEDFDPETLV